MNHVNFSGQDKNLPLKDWFTCRKEKIAVTYDATINNELHDWILLCIESRKLIGNASCY